MSKLSISAVFKSTGIPDSTYVRRENGKYEKLLKAALMGGGKICLLTGPSKTGKTTLYGVVLKEISRIPLIIRCDDKLTADEFWLRALEAINFDRIREQSAASETERSSEGEISGSIGWPWLAGLIGRTSLGISSTDSEEKVREKILAKPSPHILIPALKKLPYVLVVEDFHYLTEDVQRTIFQQWKSFVDDDVPVLVIGTTHHAVDLARANKDLLGRITQIEASTWSEEDLGRIVDQGFKKLGINLHRPIQLLLAKEAAGLPIIVQDTCKQLFLDKGRSEVATGEILIFSRQDAFTALHNVALNSYSQMSHYYDRLVIGPRKQARKFDTYQIILAIFAKDPLSFSLKRHQIDERIGDLEIPAESKPPAASVNSTLNALKSFQKKLEIELLEWVEKDQTLYMLEPSFLFYLRWREPKTGDTNALDIALGILDILRVFQSSKKAPPPQTILGGG